MQRQIGDGGIDGLPGFGAHSHYFEAGLVDFLGELIHCGVGRSTDEDGTAVLFHQLEHNRSRGHSFASARWTLKLFSL